uniref:Uncharacterized protein LOC105134595 n=1 Tax=Rhizophora mucronata TaxID=61149 RepID=A0A2P2NQ61_RHIMU
MAHSLTTAPVTATPISINPSKTSTHAPSPRFQPVWGCHEDSKPLSQCKIVHRRNVTLGLAGAVMGLNFGGLSANAARRPPPPPPEEKKDPNVSGVQAKVLASKKRKEAMKELVGKLREKGKVIN